MDRCFRCGKEFESGTGILTIWPEGDHVQHKYRRYIQMHFCCMYCLREHLSESLGVMTL